MAFNPFISFQRNKRFWMAAILMICMVSFVFCTGMRGDMSERIPHWFGLGKSGATAFTLNGRAVGRRELDDLRLQRNLANTYMKNCAEIAYKNANKQFYEMSRRVDEKDEDKRKETLAHLLKIKSTLFIRKSKPRYFESGVKFDDLVEFKLWQLEADRLGIKIEHDHVQFLFHAEFYGIISPDEVARAQWEARNEFRDANDAYVKRAVSEEFRVRIAQYALLGHQPASFIGRRKANLQDPKYIFSDFPDELRAPLTLGQVFSFWKTQCADFNVSLVPVRVQDYMDKIKEPDEIQKADFFEKNKNESYDPGSEKWGMEIPPRARFEFLIADPTSPAYRDRAKLITQLRRSSPMAVSLLRMQQVSTQDALNVAKFSEAVFDLMQPPLAVASRQAALALKHADTLEGHYKVEVGAARYRDAALYSDKDSTSPILAHFAARHPQSVVSAIGASALIPTLTPTEGLIGYLAWGTVKAPLQGTEIEVQKIKVLANPDSYLDKEGRATGELGAAIQSEATRRGPNYAKLVMNGAAGNPFNLLFPFLTLDTIVTVEEIQRVRPMPGLLPFHDVKQENFGQLRQHPRLTVETVQHELENMIAQQLAREWAQENLQEAKSALELAAGDSDKFARELRKLVPELKLTYGPSDDKKKDYHDRFSIAEAKEFEPLKEAFLKHRHVINLYEGRETPAKKLKEEDFPRMLFDGTESFSASAKFRAMPWPPEVQPDNTRDVDSLPQLQRNVGMEQVAALKKHINESDPGKKTPPLKLYQSADRPILFWRTDEINATRPDDYKKLVKDLDTLAADRTAVEADLKKTPADAELLDKLARLKKKQTDLSDLMKLASTGFKFERARKDEALPKATEIAERLLKIDTKDALSFMNAEAKKLKQTDVITLPNLSLMALEQIPDGRRDYFPPSMPKDLVFFPREVILKDFPKDKIVFPRDDMMKDLVSLIDLKNPIRTGNPELDEVNKKLFESAKDKKRFVQIVPNRPRSVFYVATVTKAPDPKTARFESVMRDASLVVPNRDLFLDRIQEQEAKAYRARFVEGLWALHKVENIDADAKKSIDGDRE